MPNLDTKLNLLSESQPETLSAQNTIVNEDGTFNVDLNAFDLESVNPNNQDIPGQSESLILGPEAEANPGLSNENLAPNAVQYRLDPVNIATQISDQLPGASLQPGSVEATSTIELKRNPGAAGYAQELTAVVYGPDGKVKSKDTIATRGEQVVQGTNGEELPSEAKLEIKYGIGDRLVVSAGNIRNNGEKSTQSGVYVVAPDGKFQKLTVEDMQGGGDKDANDALLSENLDAIGSALIDQRYTLVTSKPFVEETRTNEQAVVNTQEQRNRVEYRDWREIEQQKIRDEQPITGVLHSNLLSHSNGIPIDEEGAAIFQTQASNRSFQLGTEGASVVFQSKPLGDPTAPPTILTGTANFDPFAKPGNTIFDATATLNQFLTPTHDKAIDPTTGKPIMDPNNPTKHALVSDGIGGDPQRLAGYVPEVPDRILPGQSIPSENGVFSLPKNEAILVGPTDYEEVGRGRSWYTDNVGGLIIEKSDGSSAFIPQWNKDGFVKSLTEFEAGEINKITYALVPEQDGQNLKLNKSYPVTTDKDGNYVTQSPEGTFKVIAADKNPENFEQYNPGIEVYGVEDTLPNITNARGLIQGEYRQEKEGELIKTNDVSDAKNSDARLGNNVQTPAIPLSGEPGQNPYNHAPQNVGGLVASASLSTGVGRRDVTSTTITTDIGKEEKSTVRDTVDVSSVTPGQKVTKTPGTNTSTEIFNKTSEAKFNVDETGKLGLGDVTVIDNKLISSTSAKDLRSEDSKTTFVQTAPTTQTEKLVSSEQLSSVVWVTDKKITTEQEKETELAIAPVMGKVSVDYIQNLGGTAWTDAANKLVVGGYVQGVVAGESDGNPTEYGARAKFVLNPLGEEQKPAFNVSSTGKATPIYETKPVMDDEGKPIMTTITTPDGRQLEVEVNEFIRDANGQLMQEKTGTGKAKGPQMYGELGVNQEGDMDAEAGIEIKF
jgi:hypothetical protein